MKYSGIDLHSNNSVVTDGNDRVVAEKRLPNDLRRLSDFCCRGVRSLLAW